MIMAGVPPTGVGVYARNQSIEWLRQWDVVALNGWRADALAKGEALKAHGRPVWLYGTPEHWAPANWRASIGRLVALREQGGFEGIIADPERGWATLARATRDAEALRLGQGLAEAANETRVGVTSFPLWGPLGALAEGCGTKVWASPQLYGQSLKPETIQGWYDRWSEAFGAGRVIPSIAGWIPSARPQLASPEVYRAYLAAIPKAGGALAWTAIGQMPPHIQAQLGTYDPGDNGLLRAAMIARSVFSNPVLLIILGVVLAGVAAGAFFSR